MELLVFLLTATALSLSGVLAPGPMTAATLAAGVRSRHAGATIAVGHAVIEFPLMFAMMACANGLLRWPGGKTGIGSTVQTGIGLIGGGVLLLMGLQLLVALRKSDEASEDSTARHPLLIGIVLTAVNPYFLLWWATVGLALATDAAEWGISAFAMFACAHWLCDLIWLEALSLASHKGSRAMGPKSQKTVTAVCSLLLLFFGGKFIFDAVWPYVTSR